MKKMGDVFNLPLSEGDVMALNNKKVIDGDGVEEFDCAVIAINMHDELVAMLYEMVAIAERVDSWESFPSDPIDRANELLQRTK